MPGLLAIEVVRAVIHEGRSGREGEDEQERRRRRRRGGDVATGAGPSVRAR